MVWGFHRHGGRMVLGFQTRRKGGVGVSQTWRKDSVRD
jgi:hypothetical protein